MLTTDPVVLLTLPQQEAVVSLLTKGASLASACAALGLSVTAALATINQAPAFRGQLQQVEQLLCQNVSAALYRQAMEGNVSAQTFLLKSHPPTEWQETSQYPEIPDDLTSLTDDELDALLRNFAAALQRSAPA